MRTYDSGARTHGSHPFLKSLRGIISRWLDRERELVSLRNAVGMMSEARRADATEYHAMVASIGELRADAMRLRWLCEDHADQATRDAVANIAANIRTRSLSATRLSIDANMTR